MTGQHPDPFRFAMYGRARPLLDAVKIHIRDNVEPILQGSSANQLLAQWIRERRSHGWPGLPDLEDGT